MRTAAIPLTAHALARDLNERASRFAAHHRLPHAVLDGRTGSVLFCEHQPGCHGNFHPASYRAICARTDWRTRLNKAHTAGPRSRARADWRWRELDCAASSDALLMNVFCHPAALVSPQMHALLGVAAGAQPVFGVKPRLRLRGGITDTTEVDMQLGDLLVEAKLTEGGFQTARPALAERLVDLEAVFDRELLPRTGMGSANAADLAWDEAALTYLPQTRGTSGSYAHYQLLRGVLAAFAAGQRFCVVCDSRRVDLQQAWLAVQAAVTHPGLGWRLQLLTWQEIAACVPPDLRNFLAEKYGIEAAA